MKTTFLAVIAIGGITLGGCSKDSSPVQAQDALPAALAVIPADGQTGVRLDAGITLIFAVPVERSTVERNFHLISQGSMPDSLCPDTTMRPHGGMSGVMMDSSMMHHMGQVHSTPGRFTWSADTTMCIFMPHSMMTPRTEYMIHLGQEMMQMMRRRLGNMGMPATHGSGMMQSEMILHFTTMDTSGTGGGHGGHH